MRELQALLLTFVNTKEPTWVEYFYFYAKRQCMHADAMKLNIVLRNPLLNIHITSIPIKFD